MPIRVVTWNLYYGSTSTQPQYNGGTMSTVDRFNAIAYYASQNNIDVVFLQEHPGSGSQQTDHHGLLNGHNTYGYGYRVFREMGAQHTNIVSTIVRSYAVLTRPGVVLGNLSYFDQGRFRQYLNGPFMRAPVLTPIAAHGTNYNFLHWHNQVGNDAFTGLTSLIQGLTAAMPNNAVVIGDLNVTSTTINNHPFFNNWTDVVNNNNQNGVDHVLSAFQAHPAYNLDFMSDPYHFPIDCVLS